MFARRAVSMAIILCSISIPGFFLGESKSFGAEDDLLLTQTQGPLRPWRGGPKRIPLLDGHSARDIANRAKKLGAKAAQTLETATHRAASVAKPGLLSGASRWFGGALLLVDVIGIPGDVQSSDLCGFFEKHPDKLTIPARPLDDIIWFMDQCPKIKPKMTAEQWKTVAERAAVAKAQQTRANGSGQPVIEEELITPNKPVVSSVETACDPNLASCLPSSSVAAE